MADAGLNAVEKALVAKLVAQAGLVALIGAGTPRIYNSVVPPRINEYPVVVFSLSDSAPEGRAFSGDAESYDYLVKGITDGSQSMALAGDVAEGIDAALHSATLAPTGYTAIYAIKRQRWVRYAEPADDRGTFYHAGAVYRLWAQRS